MIFIVCSKINFHKVFRAELPVGFEWLLFWNVDLTNGVENSVTTGETNEDSGVYQTEISKNGRPLRGGLNDPRLGTVSRTDVCETCRRKYEDCPGHFGHIMLNAEIFHTGFLEPMY